MKFLKRSIPVLFAVILAVMCMVAPAFAAAPAAVVPSGSEVIYEGSAVYVAEDAYGSFGDGTVYLDSLVKGETYLVIINDVSYTIVYNGYLISCGQYEIWNDSDMFLRIAGDCEDGETYNLIIAVSPSYSGRLSGILADAGDVVTSITSWVANVARMVINTPILLIGFTIGLATLAFGIFKGLKR